MANIRRVGSWDIAGLLTRNLGRDITEEMQAALRQIGLEGEGMLKKYIRNQEESWEKLNDKYLAFKIRKGLSNKTLIASSTMIQSISSYATYPKVFIGVKRGKKYKNEEDVANIAAVMEFGSIKKNIPERPFLRPVNEKLQEKLDNNLLGKRIVEFLKKKYGIN